MKTLKIKPSTHLKLKKMQLYFNAKTLEETLIRAIEDTAAFEYEHGEMTYALNDELIRGEYQFDDK